MNSGIPILRAILGQRLWSIIYGERYWSGQMGSNGVIRLVTLLDLGQPHSEMILDLDILLGELLLDVYEQLQSMYNLSLHNISNLSKKYKIE